MIDLDYIFDQEYKGIESIEKLLTILRERGLSQMETIVFLKKKTTLSLKELDTIVLNSNAWADFKASNSKLRDSIFDSFEDCS